MQATKCVIQSHANESLAGLLAECLIITYNGIRYAQENGIDNRKRMKRFYQTLRDTKLPSCYKVTAITRACAVIKSRNKSLRRQIEVRHPKPLRPVACIISGFFITMKGRLFIPVSRDKYADIQLNDHVVNSIQGRKVRSLTITQSLLSLCYSDDIRLAPVRAVYGVDRNEKNITFGDIDKVVRIEMKEIVRINETTREILSSFKRNDVRIGKKLTRKYWKRANNRTNQILHTATNFIVEMASKNRAALTVEDLTGIRKMYQRNNLHGPSYRFRLNSWPHWKAKRMLEYKAAWKGVTVIGLSKSETYGSSSLCSKCGEKLRSPKRGDLEHGRMQWCGNCKEWIDRDVHATLNLSTRGLARFASSLPRSKGSSQRAELQSEEKGLAIEAVKGNPVRTVILRVDASKLTRDSMSNPSVEQIKS